MKDRLAPAIDAIVRVCDDIVRTIEERREEAAGLFAPKKSRRLSRLCLGFAFALAERSAADSLVRKYYGIPGAYTDAETLRRRINRTKK